MKKLEDKTIDELLPMVTTELEGELMVRLCEATIEDVAEEEEEVFMEVEVDFEDLEEKEMMPIYVAQVICACGMLVTAASILIFIC